MAWYGFSEFALFVSDWFRGFGLVVAVTSACVLDLILIYFDLL